MTKTGHIGFLEVGSVIRCRVKGDRIKIVIKRIMVDPDDKSVLIYVDHYVNDVVKENQAISPNVLHEWFKSAKWRLSK